MARPKPTDAQLMKVWQLRVVERRDVEFTAQAVGISPRSVKRHLAEARQLMSTLSYLDRRAVIVERAVDKATERESTVAVLDGVQALMQDAVRDGTAEPVDAAKVIIEAERLRVDVLGLKAPVEAHLDVTARAGQPAAPPANVAAAVRFYEAQQAAARGELPPGDGAVDAELVDDEDDDQDDDEGDDQW